MEPSDLECQNQVVSITKARGNKQRRVLLDDETLKLLSEYISMQKIPSEEQPIFSIKRRQVHTIMKKYGKMTGVDIHPHTFRHVFAIHLVRSGLDLRRVQQLLGHSNLNTTGLFTI